MSNTETMHAVTLGGTTQTEHNPAAGDKPSLTDGVLPTVAKRTMLADDSGPRARKHVTGTWARLNRDLFVKMPGQVGEVFYGARGTRVLIMQYDPDRKIPYGIRKPEEHFWRHTVTDDDLLCEFAIAQAHGYAGTRVQFNDAVRKGEIDPSIWPTPAQ